MRPHQYYREDRHFKSMVEQAIAELRDKIVRSEKQRDIALVLIYGIIPLLASLWLQTHNLWMSYTAEIVFGTLGLFVVGFFVIQYYQNQLLDLNTWFRVPVMLDEAFSDVLKSQIQKAIGCETFSEASIAALNSRRLPLIEIVLAVFYSEGALPDKLPLLTQSDVVRKIGMLKFAKTVR